MCVHQQHRLTLPLRQRGERGGEPGFDPRRVVGGRDGKAPGVIRGAAAAVVTTDRVQVADRVQHPSDAVPTTPAFNERVGGGLLADVKAVERDEGTLQPRLGLLGERGEVLDLRRRRPAGRARF